MSIAANYPQPRVEQPSLPLLIIAFGGSLTGFSGVLAKVSEAGPFATAGWRLLIAAAVLAPFLRMGGGREAGRSAGWRGAIVLVLGGVFFAVDNGLYNMSLHMTSIAHATLIVNLAPMVALAAGFLFFGERFGPAKLAGLVAALGGAALMTASRGGGTVSLVGDAIAFLAMIAYALYLISVKRARDTHDTLSIMVWSSVVGAVVLLAGGAVMGEQLLPVSASGWATLIALGLVAHVFGQGLVAFGMRQAPVGLASILLLTQPLVATIAAWAIFNETMGPIEACGAALVLAGLVIASRARQ
jgi:drug/metabolite transporter (DMT)-like permease